MKDFVAIRPPMPYLVDQKAQAPLGLLYVVGGAVQAGYEAEIYDGAGQTPAQIAREVPPAAVYGLGGTVHEGQ